MPSLVQIARDAMRDHAFAATASYSAFVALCGKAPPRVPGMDTVIRLAIRIHNGRTIEEAAAAEYLYRWRLALQSRVFGVPHTLGL